MSPHPKKTTDDLFAQFDLAVFEQVATGLFRAAGRLPWWLEAGAIPIHTGVIGLEERFPVLQVFLRDCEASWDSGITEPVLSEVWIEPDGAGSEISLQAAATVSAGRRYIAIRSLPELVVKHHQLVRDLDFTNEKAERLSLELERAGEARRAFLATMSHETRTPLNAIIGMADVLSRTHLTDEQKSYVEILQRNGVSLLTLINNILDLSKMEEARVEPEPAELDLLDVVARAIETVQARASAKGLWLRHAVAPTVPRYLSGDPIRLLQIIVNLLLNSIQFTERGGVELKVENDPENPGPGHLRFSIIDTGIGIAAEKLAEITASFTRARSYSTRQYSESARGLSICRQLAESIQGVIRAESKVGAGSTFFFTGRFGVRENQPERGRSQDQKTASCSVAELEARTEGLRILLVDDSEDNRLLILSYLKRAHCMIATAENGSIGVELFRQGRYDVVLMDLEMPVMDGYEAVREIRRFERETGATPTAVLALTAHTFADMTAMIGEGQFTELLTKPIRHVTLLEALARYGAGRDRSVSERLGSLSEETTESSFRIRVEKGMEDVVPGYLAKRRAEVAICREALKAGDLIGIAKLAHKMKGTGTGYGLPMLTEMGAAMEQAALHCDTSAIRKQVEAFASYVEKIELEYPELSVGS